MLFFMICKETEIKDASWGHANVGTSKYFSKCANNTWNWPWLLYARLINCLSGS